MDGNVITKVIEYLQLTRGVRAFFDLWLAMCGIFVYSLVLKNRKGVRAHMTNKSTMMMNLIAELSKGGATPDGKALGRPQRIIYQCSEDKAADTIDIGA